MERTNKRISIAQMRNKRNLWRRQDKSEQLEFRQIIAELGSILEMNSVDT